MWGPALVGGQGWGLIHDMTGGESKPGVRPALGEGVGGGWEAGWRVGRIHSGAPP